MARPFLPCPVCAALVLDDPAHIGQHTSWHEQTKTLGHRRGAYATAEHLLAGFREMRDLARLVAGDDDHQTQRLPPIRETVLRRPPVPEVRELRGPDLLRALADELDGDPDVDGDDL